MTPPETKSAEALRDLITKHGPSRISGRQGVVLTVTGLAVIGGLVFALLGANGNDAPRFRTQPVRQGELIINVSATGNLQPTNSVDVGSELSGIIDTVLVDVNDRVRKGQVIARLDTSKLKDQVRQAKAELASAQAKVRQSQATVAETSASLARLKEVARLSGGKVPSKAELDSGEAAALRAVADKGAAEAAVLSAKAALSTFEISLSKATIHSPIDGIVLTRKVEPGQTVAAAMTAPVLFTLAEDLRRMELQVDVDEADVGKVKEGQEARFHVDAWPGQYFPARVTRVGWGSQTKDQVVSYLTILEVRNDELQLRPGMTATAEITTAQRKDALLVPNAALRFVPPVAKAQANRSLLSSLMPRPPSAGPKVASEASAKDGTQTLWLLRDGQPKAVKVSVKGTNGQLSEVRTTDGDAPLHAGDEVIIEATVSGK
ncbi:efflux RND transporter periplasmic adaptor subunit [Zoogloea sp.]|uniref:efflux RND transporter periplasmic adaptor subunit n=1 Tax=Zoogloea sp. TaxID=49181 RepID=UPI00321F6739